MNLVEVKIIFHSNDNEKAKKEIIDILYEFGISGVKIEEPFELDPLDFYKDEKKFITNEHSVTSYFPDNFYTERRKKLIKETFSRRFALREDLIYEINFYKLNDKNYIDNWKKYFKTKKIGDKIVVKPTWENYLKNNDEIVIEVDPGRAFGTGTHPTTYMIIKLLEKYVKKGSKILDIGTGSGILMIAGEKLGANIIHGIDIDEMAIDSAKENLDLNNISDSKYKLYVGEVTKEIVNEKYNIIVANILPNVLRNIMPITYEYLSENGLLMLSGLLKENLKELSDLALKIQFKIEEIIEEKEWCGLVLKKK